MKANLHTDAVKVDARTSRKKDKASENQSQIDGALGVVQFGSGVIVLRAGGNGLRG